MCIRDRYDSVLLEGAGGLMVPLTTELLTIDYIVQEKYPLIFVTSGKLGSRSRIYVLTVNSMNCQTIRPIR